jgi:hypothetical protein
MSTCTRCGVAFGCAMADGAAGPCWCTELPPVLPVPGIDASCWCPACLRQHIASETDLLAQVAPPLLK